MNTIAIVGSRTFQPVNDAQAYVHALPPKTHLICPGASPIVLTAAKAATANGLTVDAIPLDARRPFLDRIDRLVVFAATDPATKQITSGTAGLIAQAESRSVHVELHRSPLSGRLCEAITRLLAASAKVAQVDPAQVRRRAVMAQRVLAMGAELSVERDALIERLNAGWEELNEHPDEVNEARMLKWLRQYEEIENVLRDVLAVAA